MGQHILSCLLGRFILSQTKQALPLLIRPLILDVELEASQKCMQVRVVDLREGSATTAVENEHVPFLI